MLSKWIKSTLTTFTEVFIRIGILYFIPILIMFLGFDNPKTVWLIITILTFMSYFNYFVVYLAKIINTPVAGGENGLRDMSTFWIVK